MPEKEDLGNKEAIRNMLQNAGVDPDGKKVDAFLLYYELIVEKNKVMNLTRITDFGDAVAKHFADSLALSKFIDLKSNLSVLDLGTGAGFPGIPLAIAWPELKVTMMDSVGKKINFVNEAIEKINRTSEGKVLSNAAAYHARAEELANDGKHREKYDLCVSRAVANMSSLTEYCLPFVKKGGIFAAYKAGNCGEEVKKAEKAIKILGGKKPDLKEYSLEGMERTIILIRKEKSTPKMYPRRAGTPTKSPIE